MKSYSEQIVFSADQVKDWRTATAFIASLLVAKDSKGEWLRSHELARVVESLLPRNHWRTVDGTCGYVDHSWLVWLKHGAVVLDVYAVGALPQCALIDVSMMAPAHGLYKPGSQRLDIRQDVIKWLKATLQKQEARVE